MSAGKPAQFDVSMAATRAARLIEAALRHERYFPEYGRDEIKSWRIDVDDQGGVTLMYPGTYAGYGRRYFRSGCCGYLGADGEDGWLSPIEYDGCAK